MDYVFNFTPPKKFLPRGCNKQIGKSAYYRLHWNALWFGLVCFRFGPSQTRTTTFPFLDSFFGNTVVSRLRSIGLLMKGPLTKSVSVFVR